MWLKNNKNKGKRKLFRYWGLGTGWHRGKEHEL